MFNVFKNFGWVSLSAIIKALCQFSQLIIMTRILTPEELGVFAVIMIIVGLSQVFSEAGLSQAIIYFNKLDKTSLSEIYLFNVCVGGVVSFILILITPVLSSSFDIDNLSNYLLLISPIFIIRSIGQQSSALLQKKMLFSILAKLESVASIIGFLVFVGLIYFDQGIVSLIVSQLMVALFLTLMLKNVEKTKLPVYIVCNIVKNKKVFIYGMYQTFEAMLNYISSQFDQMIIVSSLGVNFLGIYSSIKELVFKPSILFLNPIFNKVSFPLMVNASPHELKGIYFWLINSLSMILVPFYTVVFLFPSEILSFVYGPNWSQYAEIIEFLSIYMFLISIINPSGSLLKATGKVKLGFYWNVLCSIFRPLIMFFSIKFGIEAMLLSLVVYQFLILIFHCLILIKPNSNLTLIGFVISQFPPIIMTFLSWYFVNSLSTHYYLAWFYQVIFIAFIFAAMLAIYVFSICKFKGYL